MNTLVNHPYPVSRPVKAPYFRKVLKESETHAEATIISYRGDLRKMTISEEEIKGLQKSVMETTEKLFTPKSKNDSFNIETALVNVLEIFFTSFPPHEGYPLEERQSGFMKALDIPQEAIGGLALGTAGKLMFEFLVVCDLLDLNVKALARLSRKMFEDFKAHNEDGESTGNEIENLSLLNVIKTLLVNPYKAVLLWGESGYLDAVKLGFLRKALLPGRAVKGFNESKELLLLISALHNIEDSYVPDDGKLVYPLEFTAKNNLQRHKSVFSEKARNRFSSLLPAEEITTPEDQFFVFPNLAKTLKKGVETGLVVRFEVSRKPYVMLSDQLRKELFIHKTLADKANTSTSVDDERIEVIARKFERVKGFKLEELQKTALKIAKHRAGIIAGCAGSGKTTVAECLVEVLTKDLTEEKVAFGAPTGKASRRLAEVVPYPVSTIHSMFRLPISRPVPALISKEYNPKKIEGKELFVFDEMAMADTNVIYEICRRVPHDSSVFFLGDHQQLPPIGKGALFRKLMDLLPTVELAVSKRASEGSSIAFNCRLIQEGKAGFTPLKTGDDFKIIDCADSGTLGLLVKELQRVLKEVNPDDVQIISPYSTFRKPLSALNINKQVRSLFNPGEKLFSYGLDGFFNAGDRVIHTGGNFYDWRRFKFSEGSKTFVEVDSTGVINGDVGAVVGVISAKECKFDFKIRDENANARLRDDSLWAEQPGAMFVVVKFWDVSSQEDVFVLYQVKQQDNRRQEGLVVTVGDLQFLELGYALTVHKMQGSQAKSVFFVTTKDDSKWFVNRNLIYTAISRAQENVYVIGSNRSLVEGLKMVSPVKKSVLNFFVS